MSEELVPPPLAIQPLDFSEIHICLVDTCVMKSVKPDEGNVNVLAALEPQLCNAEAGIVCMFVVCTNDPAL